MRGVGEVKLGVLRGAAYGCSAWIVYGALETVLSIGAQLRGHPLMAMTAWQWRLILMLMAVYAVAGSILGAAAGLIAVTADHGESFLEHGFLEHESGTIYQENLLPLLIKYPRQREGSRHDRLVSHIDIAPTILAAVGIAATTGSQGRNLTDGNSGEPDVVFAEARALEQSRKEPKTLGVRRAAIEGRYKLISWTGGPSELYDLSSDPQEKYNLYAPDDRRAVDLAKRLKKWAASAPPLRRGSTTDNSAILRLKLLGYIQ
ncbi:MAG TPA: sulfatase/phosphatase domain-containing protein [Bryobacteraceae bacterium]|jgi:hypothetical protein